MISEEITYYHHARFQMPPHPISSISRIFFNGTPVVLFTALFLKGCGHDFPWRISKREMAMYGESSFNALLLIFHFSAWSLMEREKNSRILEACCWKIWKISFGFFLMRSDIFSRLLKWRALQLARGPHCGKNYLGYSKNLNQNTILVQCVVWRNWKFFSHSWQIWDA